MRLLRFVGFALMFSMASRSAQPQQRPAAPKSASPSHPVPTEEEWSGTLQVGETQLHLVLHLSRIAPNEWRATVDSLDQAVYGMEASKVSRTGDTLHFALDSVGAQFQGKISPDRKTLRGLWEQGGSGLPLEFQKRTVGSAARSSAQIISPVEGTWQGAIETGNMRMRLQLHVSHDDQGKLIAAIDSLDQSIQGIPASQVTEYKNELKLELPAFRAQYLGTVSATRDVLNGTWSQNGNIEKLDFQRSERVLDLRRPQTPVKPYPYKAEDVSIASANGKITLAASLTLPQGAGPFPAALLVGGSSPNDRDESISGHKPFLVLADLLTRKGIAVLRYDKRGSAQSTGNFATGDMSDFAQDVESAFIYLKSRKEIDPNRIGIIGHSEGGILAAMLTTSQSDVNWLVLLATPATTGELTLLRQSELIARAGGMPEAQITQSLDFDRRVYDAVRAEHDSAALAKKLQALVQQSGLSESMPPAALQAQIKTMTTPWFRQFLDFDPKPLLEKVQCPVLALSGDRDLQVDAAENVPLLRTAFETAKNKDFTVIEVEGVNHLFQTAQSGSPALYGAIEETIAPEVLTELGNWVAKHAAP
jgi:pimeloyl-ACP methyl ester carboxylesterase